MENGDKESGLGAVIRMITGISVFLVLIVILINTIGAADSETSRLEPSAIRLAKIFTEGAFYAIVAIGCAFCVYITTRKN